jgi:hypothetical protein
MQVDVLTMPTVTVTATDLDIRNLAFATDKVDVSGSTLDVTIAEFPTAAAASDNFANPTTTNVMSMGMLYDGSTWDRARGDSTDGALVNLGANNDVTVTGTVAVSAVSLPLPTGAATASLQTQPGVDIGDVTVNNAAGASAVNIQDGGNSITVDGPLTDAQLRATPVPVSGTVTTDTEFPVAATITDNFANPTTTSVMGMGMLWDGATWDRAKGDSTDGALVNLGANNDVTVTGTVTANAGTNLNTSLLALEAGGNLAAIAASASILDDWDETDRAKVNPIAGQAGVQGGSGVVNALTQRVVLATDVALPAGTNNIGDVDVLTVPAPLSTTGNGTAATALRVTVASDSTGTIAATQSGTWTVQPGNTPNTTAWLVATKTDLTPSAPTAASVGVASAQAVAANASRKGLVLVNTSNATISLGFGSAAVLNSGVTLRPDGVFEMDEYTFDLGAVNAIASAAASNLAIQEYS